MIIEAQLSRVARDQRRLEEPLNTALAMLLRAFHYARSTSVSRWEYAISVEEFRQSGISLNELRWLLFSGLAAHAKRISDPAGALSEFSLLDMRSIPTNACFILSDKGAKLLNQTPHSRVKCVMLQIHKSSKNGPMPIGTSLDGLRNSEDSCPVWISQHRELLFRGALVKVFRSPAPNQEIILSAFEEERWVNRVDDPLPPAPDQDPRQRLRAAIKQLNRHQENPLLRFHGDGSGRGVVWESLV